MTPMPLLHLAAHSRFPNRLHVRPVIVFMLGLTTVLSPWVVHAADTVIDNEIRRNIASTTAVITFLTSQESVSAGIYEVGQTEDTQSQFTTFKLPYRKTYPRHNDTSQWSMVMGYGRFDMHQEYDLSPDKASSNWQANSLSVGIGYSKQVPNDKARWFSRLELAYTQINHQYRLPASAVTTPTPGFGSIPFSWETDTLSLIPTAGLNIPISPQFKDWRFRPRIAYIFTQSIFEKESAQVVSAGSALLISHLNFGEVYQIKNDGWRLGLNPQVNRTDAFGAVGEGLATHHWYEMNLNFVVHSDGSSWWDGLSYGFSYLHGEQFKGGQLSISFNLEDFSKLAQSY